MKNTIINAKYKYYAITGSKKLGFVIIAPYGAFSPKIYYTLKECKKAINEDINGGTTK